ncbi:MAG: uroporphyrinogen-III synthase, partial [Halocynthiibacter sp.]
MSRPPVILITRPEKQAKRFAKMLRARFGQKVAIEISPLQQIEFTLPQVDLPQEAQFIFTSENGVKGFVKSGTPTRGTAWCVGPRTTKIAARHGFQAIDGGGTGQALIQHIKNHATPC